MDKNILVIDHNFKFRVFIHKLFNSKGYKVFQAANKYQALDIIYRYTLDIILLDNNIPGNGAIKVIDRLRKERIHIPVIVLLCREIDLYGTLQDLEEVKLFLQKPIALTELELLIEGLIKEHQVTQ